MYTIFTDKTEDFKCKIAVEGSQLSETIARLVIESDHVSLLFEGKIDSEGNCTVPIKKLKNLLPESSTGKMKLEVIAEDTFFSPWEDEYIVKTNKKVTVEMVTPSEPIKESKVKVEVIPQGTNKKNPIVEKKEPPKVINHGKVLSEQLKKEGIKISNIVENKSKVVKLIKEHIIKYNLNVNSSELLDDILKNMSF